MKRKTSTKIPKKLWRYFWDANVKKLNPSKKPYFVISRLLDKGNIEAARWVRRNYSKKLIKDTFLKCEILMKKLVDFGLFF